MPAPRASRARRCDGWRVLPNPPVFAADGIVTEEARAAYERILKLEPARVEPRFWLALAKEQDGKLAEALADYKGLLAEAPAEAPWRAAVEGRIADVSRRVAGGESQGSARARAQCRGRGGSREALARRTAPA